MDGESDAAKTIGNATLLSQSEQTGQVTRTGPNDDPIWRANVQAKFLQVIASGLSISAACRMSGVGRTTIHGWRDTDDDFRQRWLEATEMGLDHHEDNIAKAGKDDWRASEAFLKARRRETWGNATRVDASVKSEATVTGTVDGEIRHSVSGSVAVELPTDLAWLGELLGSGGAETEDQVPLS